MRPLCFGVCHLCGECKAIKLLPGMRMCMVVCDGDDRSGSKCFVVMEICVVSVRRKTSHQLVTLAEEANDDM